jgi:methylmalonyl-CoA mutase
MIFDINEPVEADRGAWLRRVEAVLKGADFDTVLRSKSLDGVFIEPLYEKSAGDRHIVARECSSPWTILGRMDDPDGERCNRQALTDLENGATGLSVVFQGAIGSYGFGLPLSSGLLSEALGAVYLDAGIELVLDAGLQGREHADIFAAACKSLGFLANTVKVKFGLNPIGLGARQGFFQRDARGIGEFVSACISDLLGQGFSGPFLAADGRVVHNAGGSEAQELAFVLASGIFYLRSLESAGFSLEQARDMIELRLSSDADQFLSIAKHRALRRLWASIEAQCGLDPKPIYVSSETSYRMMTRRDPQVNLLRTAMGCFSAAIGGANAISVLPFSNAVGLPEALARRIARNTQLVLLEEAHIAAVNDPVAGSGAFETLTDALALEGWRQFQDIEAEGGIYHAITSGDLQSRVFQMAAKRQEAIARKESILVGINAFQNPKEETVEILAPMPVESDESSFDFVRLRTLRAAQSFEQSATKAEQG